MEIVAGAFAEALLEEVFEKMLSKEVLDFIQGRKLTEGLLKKLKITLLSVNAVLDDAEEKQISNQDVKQWLEELKEAVYDAEDLLNEIKTEALRCKVEAESGSSTSKMFRKLNKKLFSTWFYAIDKAIDSKIEEIIERLDFIEKKKDVLNLKAGARRRASQTIPSTSLVEDFTPYGRNEDKETIIKLLLDDMTENKISVVPIVGMGGIGKTTLAQLVYNNVRVKQHFELQAWVCVSEEFDIVRVTQTIYGSITSGACDLMDLNMLQVKLKEALTGKKFLLVLDDVWNDEYFNWDVLRRPFESGDHGSKIIVTTRNASVASVMGTLPTHHLRQISEEDCWLLFARHAFKSRRVGGNPNLEVIGRQIIRKCKGLPLAAKSLGGLLSSESNIEEWENILKNDIWQLSDKDSNILPALWLSYHYLPRHLKRCFAYCSIFPKDYVFTKSNLVFLWMAEGLLQSKNKKTMEEVGEDYFDDLLSRSFFQHSQGEFDHQPVFTMHDLINDLAKFVCGDFCVRLEDNDSLDIQCKTRHFSYMKTYGDGFEKFEALYEAKNLRTFLPLSLRCPIVAQFYMSDKILHDLIPTLQCLRVLNLSGYNIRNLPNSISNLKHLRHLDLSYTLIGKLPDTTCTLYNLQTLLLSYCRGLVELPTNLERLINLRHLDIRGTKLEKMPPKMGKLQDLQTLSDFVLDQNTAGYDDIVELKELQCLRGTLCISGLHNIVHVRDALEANMKEKKYLNQLVLKWGGDTEDSKKDREVLDNLQPHTNLKELTIVSYEGTRFPGWLVDRSYSNLVCLRLLNCKNCYFLPPLGMLPSLRELEIIGLNGVVSIGAEFFGDDGSEIQQFRSLQVLIFENMRDWQEWSYVGGNEEGGAFPDLCELRLRNCPKLRGRLPLDYFPKLKRLVLCRTNIECLTLSQESERRKLLCLEYLYIYCPSFVCFPHGGLHAPNLTNINICRCKKLRSLPEHMHTLLPSLQSMDITECPELESFPDGGLPSKLKSLRIESCRKLIANRMQWALGRLTSLRDLRVDFNECGEVDSFPEEGLLPTTLSSLSISTLLSLKTMDGNGLTNLICLEYLAIRRCPELQSLPEEGLPTSLSLLEIFYCPLLKQRCQREKGEDWPKIAHIRHIMIDGEQI
ncbi:NB-ARC domain-containing disease resistance protein [Prunus dulcis]|uniref:NB-ARC domain-containing disease resistance protein n=1 Tax=Prunus dulcis TaxID=3755 RepID=A0A4Y1RMP6_PRUDU|nr:NB-ARC domain-containing disease resistance protein [Prunus dulcis]